MTKVLTITKKDAIKESLLKERIQLNSTVNKNLFQLPVKLEDRDICEDNEDLLQLIPYISLVDKTSKKIFIYKRGKDNGDRRLTGRCSLGLGGHIEMAPSKDHDLLDVIIEETCRELHEEVGLILNDADRSDLRDRLKSGDFGIIYYDGDHVGKVHLGISLVIELDSETINSKEATIITEVSWRTIESLETEKLLKEDIILEPWSRILLDTVLC